MEITLNHITNKKVRPSIKVRQMAFIAIHWTANTGKGANAKANRNYFQNIKEDKFVASAHYCVDDKVIMECIPPGEVGYHVGGKSYTEYAKGLMKAYAVGSPNLISIGIEMCVNSDGDWNKTVENTIFLVKKLMADYKVPVDRVVRHYDITGKLCPQPYIDATAWKAFKDKLIEVPVIEEKIYVVKAGDSLYKIAEYVYGEGQGSRFPELVTINNLKTNILSVGQKIKY